MKSVLAVAVVVSAALAFGASPATALLRPDATADPDADAGLVDADPEAAADLPPPADLPAADVGPATPPPPAPGAPQAAPPAAQRSVEAVLAEIEQAEGPPGPDLLGGLVGTPTGTVPPGHHELMPPASGDPLLASWARAANAVGVWAAALVGWLVDVVLDFDVGALLVDDTGLLAGRYARLLGDGGLPLRSLALLLAVAHAGWQVLRHRAHAAGTELVLALAIAATGAAVLADPDVSACSGLAAVRELSTGAAALVLDADGGTATTSATTASAGPRPASSCGGAGVPADAASARPADAGAVVAGAFLTEPHLLLQWGAVPAAGSPCRLVADALLTRGAWADGTDPRRWMAEAGCEPLAEAGGALSPSRAVAAVAYAGTAAAFAAAVGAVAAAVLLAQVGAALLVLLLPFAVVAGIAPGAGRQLLRTWAAAAVRCGVLALGGGFLLAVQLTAVTAVQAGTTGQGVLLRLGGSTAVAWAVVLAHRWALRRGGRPAWRAGAAS